ncbi:MAG: YraN family protein [Thermoflavifilum sp.]|nr:YraN family protein [Thermoflavifilum sp.]
MATHLQLGERGEQLACRYLQQRGFEIVATHWRDDHREIDIIARRQELLVFVEVKTRTGYSGGWPELAINSKKEEDLLLAAEHYLETHPFGGEIRFDVIAIVFDRSQRPHVFHIPDAIH